MRRQSGGGARARSAGSNRSARSCRRKCEPASILALRTCQHHKRSLTSHAPAWVRKQGLQALVPRHFQFDRSRVRRRTMSSAMAMKRFALREPQARFALNRSAQRGKSFSKCLHHAAPGAEVEESIVISISNAQDGAGNEREHHVQWMRFLARRFEEPCTWNIHFQ